MSGNMEDGPDALSWEDLKVRRSVDLDTKETVWLLMSRGNVVAMRPRREEVVMLKREAERGVVRDGRRMRREDRVAA